MYVKVLNYKKRKSISWVPDTFNPLFYIMNGQRMASACPFLHQSCLFRRSAMNSRPLTDWCDWNCLDSGGERNLVKRWHWEGVRREKTEFHIMAARRTWKLLSLNSVFAWHWLFYILKIYWISCPYVLVIMKWSYNILQISIHTGYNILFSHLSLMTQEGILYRIK